MLFQTELIPARLIKRYKRFLADAELADGRTVTAHCANPGSMMGMAEAGTKIWLEQNDDPKRKLKYAWKLIEADGHFIGVDTSAANRIAREALEGGLIPLPNWTNLRAEVKYGEGSRVDFLLSGARDIYVEVKSVTLSRQSGLAEFPDSVTARGAKHLGELAQMIAQGHEAHLIYLVQRTDCRRFDVARDIDPTYAAAYDTARAAGLQVHVIACEISSKGITATHLIDAAS